MMNNNQGHKSRTTYSNVLKAMQILSISCLLLQDEKESALFLVFDSLRSHDQSSQAPLFAEFSRQERVLAWVAHSFPGDQPNPGLNWVSCIGRQTSYHPATRPPFKNDVLAYIHNQYVLFVPWDNILELSDPGRRGLSMLIKLAMSNMER